MRLRKTPRRALCPAFILDHHRAGRSGGAVEACVVDIDLSGFTSVTDALSVHGPQGAELLASIMRSVFEPLTSCVYEFGGFITNYTGDGFLALFPQVPGQEDAVRRGLAAAWDMRQTIRSRHTYKTPLGTFEISARLGLSSGQISWRIFSAPDDRRRIYYFDGTPIVEAAQVRQRAGLGHLATVQATTKQVADVARMVPIQDDQIWRIVDVDNLSPAVEPGAIPDDVDPLVTEFFPEAIVTSEGAGEFRQTASLFIKLERPEADLDRFVQLIFEAQERYGGFINSLTESDKGCTAVVFWGAPTATENDIGRAIEFCSYVLDQGDIDVRAGLSYGLAHAGYAGSARHEVYTCSSRFVNLSARLMSAAQPGQLFMDRAARDAALNRFNVGFIGDFELKGFSDRQPIYQLGDRREGQVRAVSSGKIVEREAEMMALIEVVDQVFATKRPGVAGILGSPGYGKSVLLDELEEHLNDRASRDGQPAMQFINLMSETGVGRPFGPFRNALKTVLGLSGIGESAERQAHFETAFDVLRSWAEPDPALHEELGFVHSFLAALVDVFIPGSNYTLVDPDLRASNMSRAIVAVVSTLARTQRLVLRAEDLGEFDAESLTALRSLSMIDGPPFVILATSRIDDTGAMPALPFEPECLRTIVELKGLSSAGVRRVAERSLGAPVSTRVVELLLEKTSGNPLYLVQLIQTLSNAGGFRHRGEGQNARVELVPDAAAEIPQGLHGILVARIDRLPARLKSVIQLAAVLGQEFEAPLLRAMLGDDDLVNGALQEGCDQHIWTRQSTDRYRFNHAMLRDAVYDMQLVNVRRALHLQAAQALENLEGEQDLHRLGALAYHFERGEMPDRAQHYLLRAGDTAHDNYDPPSAIRYYRRLLNYDIDPELDVSVSERLGALLVLTSDWEEAVTTLENGLSGIFASGDTAREAGVLITLGDAFRQTGDFERARERLDLACSIARRAGNQAMLGKALGMLAGTNKYSGNYLRSLELYEKALEVGENASDDRMIAVSLAGIASIHGLLGNFEMAIDCNRRAIPILERLGDRQELAYPVGNLGIDLFTVGAHDQALSVLDQAMRLASEIGDRTGIWLASHFIGRVHHEACDFQAAIRAYERAMVERRALGGDSIPFEIYPHLASARTTVGDYMGAVDALSRHMDMLNAGALDHEHGLTYHEVARLISLRDDLPGDVQAKLDTLVANGFGPDPMVWLKEADKGARAGASMGLNSRMRTLVKCAAIWAANDGHSMRVLGCLAAAYRLADEYSMAREADFVRDRAASLGISFEDLTSAEPLYFPFGEIGT